MPYIVNKFILRKVHSYSITHFNTPFFFSFFGSVKSSFEEITKKRKLLNKL
jgi:hypothetical protein